MKKVILGCLAISLFISAGAWADTLYASSKRPKAAKTVDTGSETTAAPDTEESPWSIGFGTGPDLVDSNWDPNYQVGGGGVEFIGYKLDKNLSLRGEADQWIFTGGGFSDTNPRFLLEVKYTFEGQGWQPYILAGPGFALQYGSPSGESTTNADALAGVGAQLDLGGKSHLFLEARYNLTLTQDVTLGDVPIVAGLWVGL
jgi:opacity protein-like surface antigen